MSVLITSLKQVAALIVAAIMVADAADKASNNSFIQRAANWVHRKIQVFWDWANPPEMREARRARRAAKVREKVYRHRQETYRMYPGFVMEAVA